jgi:hypothetical protein
LGAANKTLGMRITRDRKYHKLTLSQGEYMVKVLERFRMKNPKLVSTPLISGVVCPYTPQNINKLTLQPRKEAITREIPYLVQALTR